MRVTFLGCGQTAAHLALPLFGEAVSAGFPSPAQDYVEQTLDLNELCVQHPAATFFVRAQGDSMEGAGIFADDVLVVDRAVTAGHGDVVIAALHGEFTVKQLQLQPVPQLVAANPRYAPIALDAEVDWEVFGVVTHVIHRMRGG